MTNQKNQIGFSFLFMTGVLFCVAAWLFNQYQLQILEKDPLILTIYNENHPLKLGSLALTTLFMVWAHLFFTIITDLYASVKNYFLPLLSAVSVLFISFLFGLVPSLPYLEGGITLSTVLHSVINFDLLNTLFTALAIFATHFCGIAGFQMMRKLLRGHLVLPEYIFSSLFAAFSFASIYTYNQAPSKSAWIALSLTVFIQFLIASLVSIPLFYMIRLPFRLFSGEQYKSIKNSYRKKSLFKPEEKDFMESHGTAHENKLKPVPEVQLKAS